MSILHEIKTRKYNIHSMYNLCVLYIKKMAYFGFSTASLSKALPVDIVIPTITKDKKTLHLLIEAIRRNVINPITRIYIVSRPDETLQKFCADNDITFIPEDGVLGYGKKDIVYNVHGTDRSGWMFQQLLKLSANTFVTEDNYIVIDSDTILLNPHQFNIGDTFVLCNSTEWHIPYFKAYNKLIGKHPTSRLSFVAHMMIFNKDILAKMKQAIEQNTGKAWDKAIQDTIDQNEISCFSEYETYGNYLLATHPERIISKPFYNTSLPLTCIASYNELATKYSKSYNSISFHNYEKR